VGCDFTAFLQSGPVRAALNKTGSALAAITVLKKICDHPRLLSEAAAAEIANGA
jgi:SNF2 family DNA or RNA helicase